MTKTVFFRLLADDDKGVALGSAIEALREGQDVSAARVADTASFAQIPGSPFAYWVSEDLRRKFVELPRFQSQGRVACVTNPAGDDQRFFRSSWEVDPKAIGRERKWVPLAKGGAYAPFYADIHLLVAWDESEQTYRGFLGTVHRPLKRPASLQNFFRPGLTWPRRTNGLSFRALPADSIFADKGPAIFVEGDNTNELLCLAAIANSRAFFAFVELMLARDSLAQSFEVGLIQSVPVPTTSPADLTTLAAIASSSVDHRRTLDQIHETSHVFVLPVALAMQGNSLTDRFTSWGREVTEINAFLAGSQARIDDIVFQLYSVSELDRQVIAEASRGGQHDIMAEENENDDDDAALEVTLDRHDLAADLISYLLGCVFGRWDIRIALDDSLAPKLQGPFEPLPACSPGMLVGPDGLPATRGQIVSEEWLHARPNAITAPPEGSVAEPVIPDDEYPMATNWDGILVDDPNHPEDLVRRLRDVLHVLWSEQADTIEREACQVLGVQDLRKYLSDPRRFFESHLKRYSKSRRKAPIYWPLSTTSGSYMLWLYYPRLTSDTLYTAVNRYVEPRLYQVSRSLHDVETRLAGTSGREASQLRTDLERLSAFQAELSDFRAELLRVAALPYRPNLDDGVIINAAPLHTLFRHRGWARATRDCWQKLERGDYDWAHLAYQIWPERVREKCRSDRSLAIAHDLEDLYVAPPTVSKKAGKRGRPQATLLAEDEA